MSSGSGIIIILHFVHSDLNVSSSTHNLGVWLMVVTLSQQFENYFCNNSLCKDESELRSVSMCFGSIQHKQI